MSKRIKETFLIILALVGFLRFAGIEPYGDYVGQYIYVTNINDVDRGKYLEIKEIKEQFDGDETEYYFVTSSGRHFEADDAFEGDDGFSVVANDPTKQSHKPVQ